VKHKNYSNKSRTHEGALHFIFCTNSL
jgi:hypothetical protein